MSDQVPLNVQQSFPNNGGSSQNLDNSSGNVQAHVSPQFSGHYERPQSFQEHFQAPPQAQLAIAHSTSHNANSFGHDSLNSNEAGSLRSGSFNSQSFSPPRNSEINDTLVQMEQDSAQLRMLDSQLDKIVSDAAAVPRTEEDDRSIYIGNVDYGATPLELQQHFSENGVVERVTIMTNKLTGHPKGFAYLEFATAHDANKAVETMNGSMFRDRELKVSLKRTNVPGLSATNRGGPRGRGRGRGMMRGRGRAGFRGRGSFRGGGRFQPY